MESTLDLAWVAARSDALIAAGTVAAAIIAAMGLFLTRRAIIEQSKLVDVQTKSVDVQTWLSIFFAIRESERELQEVGRSDTQMRSRLIEHFNFLELLAQLHNSRSLTRQADNICKDFLLNHLAVLQLNEPARDLLERSVTSSETFENLAAFVGKYKVELECRRDEILRSQASPSVEG